MINLYFKGGLTGISEGTMITAQSEDQEDIYKALKNLGCSELIAKTGKYRSLWETAQERDRRMAKPSNSSISQGVTKTKVEKEDSDDVLDDNYDEPSAWYYMSFFEKVKYIFTFKWIDDFLDNLPKRFVNAILSFLFLEIMAVIWLLASLCSECWRNAVWKAIYKSVKWLNRLLD
jgi:hypothetical protein